MVLHNLFFLVLTCAAYFTLIPLFEKQVADAQAREVQILEQAAAAGGRTDQPGAAGAILRSGAAREPRSPCSWCWAAFTCWRCCCWNRPSCRGMCTGRLQRMLDADAATQAGDRERELIPESEILGDEIGQLMRSRNETVAALRRQEDELASGAAAPGRAGPPGEPGPAFGQRGA